MTKARYVMVSLMIFGIARSASAQRLQNTANGTLSTVTAYGTLTPGSSNTPSTTTFQFRIRSNSNTGYNVRATLNSFNVTPASPASGGVTISASDIGVAITSVDTSRPGVNTPRTDTIANGLNYNPGSVTAANGIAPYRGIANGQATLANLANTKILNGPRIAANENANGNNNYITVTMTLGLLREYFTPASFSAVIGLTISDGQ
jgi:hypothetical protein